MTPNQALSKYLMASYLYYIRFQSVIPDHEYDHLARFLLEHWDAVEHQHKYLVLPEDLQAGTLFGLSDEKYPLMVKGAAEMWLRDVAEKEAREIVTG